MMAQKIVALRRWGHVGSSSEWNPEDNGMHVLDLALTGIQKMMPRGCLIWSWLMGPEEDGQRMLDLVLVDGSRRRWPEDA